MRDVKLGDMTLRISANALLPIVFEDEFRRDLMTVVAPIVKVSNAASTTGEPVDMSSVSIADMERVLWAEAKAADPHNVPSFMPWLESLDDDALSGLFDEKDPVATEIFEELKHGFLSRRTATRQTAAVKTSHK